MKNLVIVISGLVLIGALAFGFALFSKSSPDKPSSGGTAVSDPPAKKTEYLKAVNETNLRVLLEEKGWVFKEEKSLDKMGIRFVRYEKKYKECILSAEVSMLIKSNLIHTICFSSRGPITTTGKDKGIILAICISAAKKIYPDFEDVIYRADKAVQKKGGTSETGFERMEGVATSKGGWTITLIDYMKGFKHGNSLQIMLMISKIFDKENI